MIHTFETFIVEINQIRGCFSTLVGNVVPVIVVVVCGFNEEKNDDDNDDDDDLNHNKNKLNVIALID